MDQHEPPRQLVPVLELADGHLHEQQREQDPGPGASTPARSRLRASQTSSTRNVIPNAAVARTWI